MSTPEAAQVERSVLATMMIDRHACKYGLETLDVTCFNVENNQRIFVCIVEAVAGGAEPDLIVVCEYLRRHEWLHSVGGEAGVSELVADTSTTSNIVHHAKILVEKAVLRGCGATFQKAVTYTLSSEAVPDKVLDAAEKRLVQFRKQLQKVGGKAVYDHCESVGQYVELLEKRRTMKPAEIGLAWPVRAMNDSLGVAQRGKIVLCAGYEKGGKSRFVRCCVSKWLNDGHAGVFILTEESDTSVHQCVLGARCRIDTKKLEYGHLSDIEMAQIRTEADRLAKQPLSIIVAPRCSPETVREILERERVGFLKIGKKLDFCVIDTVQKMHKQADSANESHEEIASDLAVIVSEFNVAMVQIMQYISEAERGSRTKSALHSRIRYGKPYRETADCILTFDDRRKAKRELEEEKKRGYRVVRCHVVQREGESHIHLDIKAELQYSNYTDREDADAEFEVPTNEPKETEHTFFDGIENVDIPKSADGEEMF